MYLHPIATLTDSEIDVVTVDDETGSVRSRGSLKRSWSDPQAAPSFAQAQPPATEAAAAEVRAVACSMIWSDVVEFVCVLP